MWRHLSCTKHSATRSASEFFGGKFGSRATIPTSFETDWFSAGFNRPKPRFGFSVTSQHEGFTRHGTGNSEVVQRRQGFWLHQSAEWRGCVCALLRDQHEWLQEPAGRSSCSVQRGEGAQGLAGVRPSAAVVIDQLNRDNSTF